MVHFECCDPILRVEDLQASVRFYTGQLGFEEAEWGGSDFTHVRRDSTGIYLCRGEQGRGGSWVWIGVSDAAELHREYAAKGVTIRLAPTVFPWALEFQVEDPDGNVIRFGSDPGE